MSSGCEVCPGVEKLASLPPSLGEPVASESASLASVVSCCMQLHGLLVCPCSLCTTLLPSLAAVCASFFRTGTDVSLTSPATAPSTSFTARPEPVASRLISSAQIRSTDGITDIWPPLQTAGSLPKIIMPVSLIDNATRAPCGMTIMPPHSFVVGSRTSSAAPSN